jgi:hypothetical protein
MEQENDISIQEVKIDITDIDDDNCDNCDTGDMMIKKNVFQLYLKTTKQ